MSNRSFFRSWQVICLLMISTYSQADGPDAAAIRSALEIYNSYASVSLPIPDSNELERISDGDDFHIRERTAIDQSDGNREDRIRVVGHQLVNRPRLLVWLATLDIDTKHSSRLTEYHIENDNAGGSLWYQYLDTPWPVRDRHWVVRNAKNIELEHASKGQVWEQVWRLEPDGPDQARNLFDQGKVSGLSDSDADRAIYLTVNRGAWSMITIDEMNTLVVASTIAVMAGWIPESWVASFVSKQLGHVMSRLETRSN